MRRIATGGMATVYQAEHVLIGRSVAIKVLHPQYAQDTECVRRFLAEGRTAGTLGHPHIVESTDMGYTASGAPFLVLEFLEGRNLEQLIRQAGRLAPDRAVHIAQQIASALAAAHARGIIHRDLKSANVFLVDRASGGDLVKVLDFGISKFTEGRGHTQKDALLGTPWFMAPEQISDPSSVDGRADVYALGVLLYEMLSGGVPFAETPWPALVSRILWEEPTPIEIVRPEVGRKLAALVNRAMAKSVVARIQSMEEVGAELAATSGRKPLGVSAAASPTVEGKRRPKPPLPEAPRDSTPLGTPVVAGGRSAAQPPSVPPVAVPPARRRRVRTIAIAATTLAVWVAVGAAYRAKRETGSRDQTADTPSGQGSKAATAKAPTEKAPTAASLEPSGLRAAEPRIESLAGADSSPSSSARPAQLADPDKGAAGASTARPLDPHEGTEGLGPAGSLSGTPARSDARMRHRPRRPDRVASATDGGATGAAIASPSRSARRLEGAHDGGILSPFDSSDEPKPPADPRTRGPAETPALPADPAPRSASGTAPTPPVPRSKSAAGTAPKRPADPALTRPAAPARAAPPAPAKGPAPGTMDREATRRAVHRHLREVRSCFERGRMDNPQLAGRVLVRISVAPSGKVSAAQVASTTLRSQVVEDCIVSMVKTWTLPTPAGGVSATITYPFAFQ